MHARGAKQCLSPAAPLAVHPQARGGTKRARARAPRAGQSKQKEFRDKLSPRPPASFGLA